MPNLTVSMQPDGPIINLQIGVSVPRRKALEAAGKQVPPTVTVGGLINPGASCTVIDRKLLRQLGINATGQVAFRSTAQGTVPEMSPQYDVSIAIAGFPQLLTEELPVLEGGFTVPSYQAIIGRDVLRLCRLTLDGPGRNITLQY
jgi:hypothetical protein